MPKYVYSCDACQTEFEAYHGMMEKMDYCTNCEQQNCVVRIPQLTSVVKKDKTGQQVKQAIEENREILKQMRENNKRSYDE